MENFFQSLRRTSPQPLRNGAKKQLSYPILQDLPLMNYWKEKQAKPNGLKAATLPTI